MNMTHLNIKHYLAQLHWIGDLSIVSLGYIPRFLNF